MFDRSLPQRFKLAAMAVYTTALLFVVGNLQAAQQFQFVDTGVSRNFTLAEDEVFVARHAQVQGDLAADIEGKIQGSHVSEKSPGAALIKLPDVIVPALAKIRADVVSTALPDADVYPVLYQTNTVPGRATRRVITPKILVVIPQGETIEQIGALVGAVAARPAPGANGYGIIVLPSAYHVLDALDVLKLAGIKANPMLGRSMAAYSALPKDQFFPLQWHLYNTGQGGSQFRIDANVLDAWDVTLGQGVTVAVVDSCLETGHPDLIQNVPDVSTHLHHNFLDLTGTNPFNPNPQPGNAHGTSVAGVIAAAQNNGTPDPSTGALVGVTGAAPNARLLGLRLINEGSFVPTTDEEEGTALFWQPNNTMPVDACNNSWGPVTVAAGLVAPDVLASAALQNAVLFGRQGRGQITLFAAGNGQLDGSEANQNGYANNRYVIAVGAINNQGKQSFYSESGANLLISAPSDGGTLGIVTTDVSGVAGYNPPFPGVTELPNTDYTNEFGGTSSATPLVTGSVSLLLAANPALGWRDVKEILASTARQIDSGDSGWVANAFNVNDVKAAPSTLNGGGFKFNNKYGGGMVDASAAVIRGLNWTNLDKEVVQEVFLRPNQLPVAIPDDGGTIGLIPPFSNTPRGLTVPFAFTGPNFPNLRVETVEVQLKITDQSRSDLEIHIISPNGTDSVLAPAGIAQGDNQDYKLAVFRDSGIAVEDQGWTFTSTHSWGENSTGTWRLRIFDQVRQGIKGVIQDAHVRLYGTLGSTQRFTFEHPLYQVNEPTTPTAGTQRVNVLRLGSPTGTASVQYATSNRGSATAAGPGVDNADYSPVAGTLVFEDGETSKEIDIPILHNPLPKGTSTIYLLLNNPVGASLGGVSLATVDVFNSNQVDVTVQATTPVTKQPTEGVPTDNGVFTISRTVAEPEPLTVHFSITGTAAQGNDPTSDFAPVPTSVTIPANEQSTTVQIVPHDNGKIQGTVTVDLTLTGVDIPQSGQSVAIGVPNTAEVQILCIHRPRVQVVTTQAVMRQNDSSLFGHVQITRTDDNSQPLTVNLGFGGNQINGVDYVLADTTQPNNQGGAIPSTVVIPAGQSTLDLPIVPVVPNNTYKVSRQIVINLEQNPLAPFEFGFITSAKLVILGTVPPPDSKIPKLKITSPTKNQTFSYTAQNHPAVTLSGTAADNQKVVAIEYRFNKAGEFTQVAVTQGASISWLVPSIPAPDPNDSSVSPIVFGPNTVEVRSVDNVGNRSASVSTTFNYLKQQTLTVGISGNGTITPGFIPSSIRNAGFTYQITANPGPGQVFVGWTGLVTSSSRTISVTMPNADATLHAAFVTSPFTPTIIGRYTGLARDPNSFFVGSSGYLDITVGAFGSFTGKLLLGADTFALKGQFSGEGLYQGLLPRKGNFPLQVNLALDINSSGTKRITGTILSPSPAFTLVVQADKAVFSKTAPPPVALVKSYTMYMPPLNDPNDVELQFEPHGDGIATVQIDSAGVVHAKGTLGDGTKFTLTQPLTKDLTWPFFLQPYKKKGVVIGTITQDATQANSDFHGTFDWTKNQVPTDTYFPLPFTLRDNPVFGSVYAFSGFGAALTGYGTGQNNAQLIVQEGNIGSQIISNATLTGTNALTVQAPAGVPPTNLSITLSPKTGTFTGSFVHPISLKKTAIQGVLFQKTHIGIGTFLGSTVTTATSFLQTGEVLIQPHP